jgi:hypothetical protein
MRSPADGSRAWSLALALFYAGAATELPFLLADELFPSFVASGDDDFPCAGHGCCCKSKADCQRGCCCFPRKVKGDARPAGGQGSGPERVRLIDALRCAGFPGPASTTPGGSDLSPHLLPVLASGAECPGFSGRPGAFDRRLDSTNTEIPEPVPRPVG